MITNACLDTWAIDFFIDNPESIILAIAFDWSIALLTLLVSAQSRRA